MMLCKKHFLVALIFIAACAAFAQNTASLSLETEIRNIENSANRQNITAQERQGHLVRLARLRQLSGDIEGATRNWLEAATAVPGRIDEEALLACAYCLAAMGEWERAAAALEPLADRVPRARVLDEGIKAIVSADTSSLVSLAAAPSYSQFRGEIYFLLWKLSSGTEAENWRRRLAVEFPQSPEGRLAAANNSASSAIAVRPSPFWLLMGFEPHTPVSSQTAASAMSPQQAEAEVRLQTGLFSREVNAEAQAVSLRQAGYSSVVEQRTVNDSQVWAVVVPVRGDANRIIAQLRDIGFESFPVR